MIHADLHYGNMFVHNDMMTFFDWDDSSYQPFINDFSVIIFDMFAYSELSDYEKALKANEFLVPFCKGYNEENKLDIKWFDYFHDFMKYREAIMYIMLHAAGDKLVNSPFGKRYLNGRRERIINNIPLLDISLVLKDIK